MEYNKLFPRLDVSLYKQLFDRGQAPHVVSFKTRYSYVTRQSKYWLKGGMELLVFLQKCAQGKSCLVEVETVFIRCVMYHFITY